MNKDYNKSNIIINKPSVSVSSLLGIVFIVLKLCGIIKWSWWWVTAPLWIPIGLVLLLFIIALIIACIAWVVELYETKH